MMCRFVKLLPCNFKFLLLIRSHVTALTSVNSLKGLHCGFPSPMNCFKGRKLFGMVLQLVLPTVRAVDECARAKLTMIRPSEKALIRRLQSLEIADLSLYNSLSGVKV